MGGGGGQDGCERRIEVFMKIQKKYIFFFLFFFFIFFFWGGGQVGGWGQGRCEQRSEVFVKIKKMGVSGQGWGGGFRGGGWFRVDVNEELKFL